MPRETRPIDIERVRYQPSADRTPGLEACEQPSTILCPSSNATASASSGMRRLALRILRDDGNACGAAGLDAAGDEAGVEAAGAQGQGCRTADVQAMEAIDEDGPGGVQLAAPVDESG